MRLTPALFPLCLALALPGCNAPPALDSPFDTLLDSIEQRLDLAQSVAQHKWQHGLPVHAPARERQVLAQVRLQATDYDLQPERAEAFFSDQIEANKLIQYALLDRWNALGQAPLSAQLDLANELRPRLDKLQARLLFALGELDRKPPANCSGRLAQALSARTNDALHHLALVRATGQLCRQP